MEQKIFDRLPTTENELVSDAVYFFYDTFRKMRTRQIEELAGRAKGRIPALENRILIDDAENVRSIE